MAYNFCVLIPSLFQGKNTHWLLKQCLSSIREYEPALLKHTFILDDASTHPDTREMMKSLTDEFRCGVVWKGVNTSYSDNINGGLRLARGLGYDVAVTLNNDVQLHTPFVGTATALFESFPKCGVLGAFLKYPDGKTQHQGFNVDRDHNCDDPEYKTFSASRPSGFVMGVTGALQILKLALVQSYPTQYQLAYEDVHFCLDHWEQDGQVYYTRDIQGTHQESATRGTRLGTKEHQSRLTYLSHPFDFELIENRLQQALADITRESSLPLDDHSPSLSKPLALRKLRRLYTAPKDQS